MSRFPLILVALAVAVASCGFGSNELVAGPGDLGHVHDIVVDTDGAVLVASHTGLYRIEDPDRAVLIGTERHDLMAMTAGPDGDLLVSGHPDLRLEDYRVEDRPPFLGLTRSGDQGASWEPVELLGEADFHSLVPVGDQIFAAETGGSIWRLDPDGSWNVLGEVEARDLAVNPQDPSQQLGADWDGGVWASSDGALSWVKLDQAPEMVEIEWLSSGVIGFAPDGLIWAFDPESSAWSEVGKGPEGVETLMAESARSWWVAVEGGEIYRSETAGADWTRVYSPPSG